MLSAASGPNQLLAWLQHPNLLARVSLAPRPGLLVLICLLFVGLWAILARYHPNPGSGSGEFVLHTKSASSNLNDTSAETAERHWNSPFDEEVDTGHHVANADEATRANPVPAPQPAPLPPVDAPAILLVSADQPPAELCYLNRDLHRGDTPMLRTWRLIAFNTLFATLLATPRPTAASEGPPSDSKKLDEIQKQLDELKKSVKAIQTAVGSLGTLDTELRNLRTDNNLALQKTQNDVNALRDEISKLKDDVEALRRRLATPARTAASPPTDTPPQPVTGRVELQNTWPEPMSVAVNRVIYRVQPGETRLTDPLPVGTFTYEVIGVTPPITRSLTANQVYQIHIHP
jgi:hypothetical protein